MWVGLGIRGPLAFVWEDVVDGPEGEHDEAEGGVGRVEAVGPVDDEPHPAVESFVAGIVDPEPHGGEDPVASFADRLGGGDERLEPAARRLRAEPVEQFADLVFGEVGELTRPAAPPSVRRPATGRRPGVAVCGG